MRTMAIALLPAALLIGAPALAQDNRDAEANRAFTVYPQESLDNGEQGAVHYRVKLDASGRPTDCEITESSGYRRLDLATCAMLLENARFTPDDGKNVYAGRVVWKIS